MAWDSDPDDQKFSIISPCKCAKSHVKKYQDGIAEGYEIVCMDGSFHVHEYCLYNSEFLYKMLQGSDTAIIHISGLFKNLAKILTIKATVSPET